MSTCAVLLLSILV